MFTARPQVSLAGRYSSMRRRGALLAITMLVLALLAPALLHTPQALAQGTPPTLTTNDASSFTKGSAPVVISPNLTITGSGTITNALVLITDNFVANLDRLGIQGQSGSSGTVSGLGWSYNASAGVLSFNGAASVATYQSVLRQVTFQNSNNTSSSLPRVVVFSLGSSLPYSDNGHYYEFVAAPGITWLNARTATGPRAFFGLQGYLTTVTSQSENAFVASKLQGFGWLGATDDSALTGLPEGRWIWVTGPEAGDEFFNDNINPPVGAPVNGRYNNWADGEPNDAFGEDYAHFLENGQWNDYDNDTFVDGYVVEYGGLEGDPVLQITDDVTVTIALATPTISQPLTLINSANSSAYTVSGSCTAGLVVTVTIGNVSEPVNCAGGGSYSVTFDVSAVSDNASLAVTARQSDGTLTSAQASATVRKDTVAAPLTINQPRPAITQSNRTRYPVGGACEASATLTVTISTLSRTATCAANGTYSVSFDVTALADAASVPIGVSQRDTASNSAGPVNTTALKDTVAAPLTINQPRPAINRNNRTRYPVGGACEAGGTVTIQIGSITRSTPCLSNGTYITNTNVSSLPDADAVAISVRLRDRYNNAGGPVNTTALKDTVAPPVTISTSSPVNSTRPTFSGTAEPNASVTIIVEVDNNGNTSADRVLYRTTASATGQWSVNLQTATPISGALPAAGLPRPGTIGLAAIARDVAGNQGPSVNKQIVIQ